MVEIFLYMFVSILSTASQASVTLDTCKDPACLRLAERVNAQIDPNINPCDDFYRFACGKFLANATDVEKHGKFEILAEKAEKETIQLYQEPVQKAEHHIVQAAKKLFQACMDLPKIEENNLKTIKEVLETVGGGWPLVEGDKWDEAKFNWLEATYKLRRLGYPYSAFLGLKVEDDPRNNNRSLFQVNIPIQYSKEVEEQKETITKLVAVFGVDTHDIVEDMAKMVEFEENLIKISTQQRRLELYPIYTVDKLQGMIDSINWLEFINNISGPVGQVSLIDSVLVVKEDNLQQWLDIIGRASKRTQANYLMWKMIEEMLPYLTSEIRNLVLSENELKAPREAFCLNATQERFTPSPINMIHSRKSFDKKKQVEEMALNIRDALLNSLHNSFLARQNQETVADKLRNMALVIGELDDTYEKSLLDNLIVDMREITDENFLNLLTQANRNHISLMYGTVKKSNHEKQLNHWYTLPSSFNVQVKKAHNVLRIPASQLEEPVFYHNKLNYINYGILGKEIGKQLHDFLMPKPMSEEWTGETIQSFMNGIDCLINDIQKFQQLITFDQAMDMQSNIFGAKLAHSAYQKWSENNEENELKVHGTNYTTQQLFWISTVDCKYFPAIPPPAPLKGILLSEYQITMSAYRDFPRTLVSSVMRNIPDFGKDFNCLLESPMNPSERCKIL